MAERILATRQLTKRYGHTAVLQRVDMHIEQGQIYGLVGKNGAGKTTLMRLIAAQSLPSEGVIELFGKTSPRDLNAQRARVGAIIETPSFYPFLTAEQNLEYYRIQRGIPSRASVGEALELAGLSGAARKKFKHFSLGMKQRLGLALAVMGDPELLLLDEPINGLDPMGIVQFREILQNLNAQRRVTILISSHILSELSNLATHYGFLDRAGCSNRPPPGRSMTAAASAWSLRWTMPPKRQSPWNRRCTARSTRCCRETGSGFTPS